jgi:hypothetical protein
MERVMTTNRILLAAVCATALVSGAAPAAAPPQETQAPVGLTSRRTTAVTYEARRTTKIDMIGTPLLPRARGEAEIETEASGPVRIKVEVQGMMPAGRLGPEYLTYVLWAIPPRGRAKNLGELRPDDGDAEMEATSDVQTFALIITAEPYYAVTTPGDVVVLENAVRPETRGRTSIATLQYEIVPRGAYLQGAGHAYALPAPSRHEPPDVQQARNAVAIARIAQAPRFAPEALATAQRLLVQVEQLVAAHGSSRDIISWSRAAVQAAEEARLQSVGRRRAEEADAAEDRGAPRSPAGRGHQGAVPALARLRRTALADRLAMGVLEARAPPDGVRHRPRGASCRGRARSAAASRTRPRGHRHAAREALTWKSCSWPSTRSSSG